MTAITANADNQICLPHTGPHYSSFLFAQEKQQHTDQDESLSEPAEAQPHTEQARALLRQISVKAPQMAGVLELLEQQGPDTQDRSLYRLEFTEPLQPEPRAVSLLELTTGLLSNAFPQAAPLFHSCRAYLHLKLLKKAG